MYDVHLSDKEILQQYSQSLISMKILWSNDECLAICAILKRYFINGIVNIVIEYCLG